MIKHWSLCLALTVLGAPAAQADTFVVQNLDDSGAGSLREAVQSANGNAGPDTIEFANGVSGTVVLESDLPPLTDDVDILGPGAGALTVSGDSQFRPFSVAGGAIVTISGMTITDGLADFGAAILNEGDLAVLDCVLSGNHGVFNGGAIDNFGGTLLVDNCVLSNNTTGEFGFGGAISNDSEGTLTVSDSTLTGNSADFSGGAIDSFGTAMILRSTLSNNSAEFGSGIENGGMLTVRNSTLSGNTFDPKDEFPSGGGIENFEGETIVEFSTVTENTSPTGAGIANFASLTIKHSLVVNNTGSDCEANVLGTFTALGTNFATDATCPGFTQTTPGGVNLGPLADNGGPTHTHALQSGSVAIDAAVDCTQSDGATPVTQDQRGESRPSGPECDSGAFEADSAPSGFIFGSGFEQGEGQP